MAPRYMIHIEGRDVFIPLMLDPSLDPSNVSFQEYLHGRESEQSTVTPERGESGIMRRLRALLGIERD